MLSNERRQRKPRVVTSKRGTLHPASCTIDSAKPPLYGWEEADDAEIILRQFDMDMKMGPCLGMTRLERWNRAQALGLKPSPEVLKIIQSSEAITQSLWDQDNRIPRSNKK